MQGISVIIVSYNVRHVLSTCINSILRSAKNYPAKVDITVVDNHSTDNTLDLKSTFLDVNWVELKENLGFGTACNIGVKHARAPYLLFLNPDTIIEENTLKALSSFFENHQDAGVVGCKIKNSDNSLQLACRRSFPTPGIAIYRFVGLSRVFPQSKIFGKYNLTYLDENKECEVDAVSGSIMCISRSDFDNVKGFDEDFFMYGEDLDLCYRIKLSGKKNYYTPETTILHMKGESTKSRPIRSLIHFYRAMIIFSKKHLELKMLPMLIFYIGASVLAVSNFIYNRWKKWPRWFIDLCAVNVILALVTWGYAHFLGFPHIGIKNLDLYLTWHFLLSLLIFGFLGYAGDYGKYIIKDRNIYYTVSVPFLTFFTLGYFFYEEAYSRIVFGVTGFLSYLFLVGWRLLASKKILTLRKWLVPPTRVLILGEMASVRKLRTLIDQGHLPGYEFMGMIDDAEVEEIDGGKKFSTPFGFRVGKSDQIHGAQKLVQKSDFIGNLVNMPKLLKKLDIHEIIIAKKDESYNLAVKILSKKWNGTVPIKILTGEPAPRSIMLIEVNFTERTDFKGN